LRHDFDGALFVYRECNLHSDDWRRVYRIAECGRHCARFAACDSAHWDWDTTVDHVSSVAGVRICRCGNDDHIEDGFDYEQSGIRIEPDVCGERQLCHQRHWDDLYVVAGVEGEVQSGGDLYAIGGRGDQRRGHNHRCVDLCTATGGAIGNWNGRD